MKPLLIIPTVLLTLLFAGCKKDKNNSVTGNKLKAGRWQISAASLTTGYNGKDTTIDYYSGWLACEQDDYIEFGDKGMGTSNENSNKCPEDAQVTDFEWELQDNDSKLKITLTGGAKIRSTGSSTAVSDIVEIASTHLKLKHTEVKNGQSAVIIETYKNTR